MLILIKRLILLFILTSVLVEFSFAQGIYFNNIYNPWNTWSGAFSIIERTNDYVVCGISGDPATGLKKIAIISLDLGASINETWLYGPNNYHTYPGWPGSFIQLSNGGFALFGTLESEYEHLGYFVKFDSRLDTLITFTYADTINNALIGVQCKELNNGGFILLGYTFLGEENIQITLIRTDNQGSEIWRRNYGDEKADKSRNIVVLEDGYLIGGMHYDIGNYSTADPIVIKTDTMGNLKWIKSYGDTLDDYGAVVCTLSDGNYLIATAIGTYQPYPIPFVIYTQLHFIKTDTSGNVLWDKKYGVSMDVNYPNMVRQLENGDIIACGGSWMDTIIGGNIGWAFKLSSEGDSIWYRRYKHFSFNVITVETLKDIIPTMDEGFIATGVSSYPEQGISQSFWIVKMDSLGCDSLECNPYVGIKKTRDSQKTGFNIFPNPSKEFFTIIFPKDISSWKQINMEIYNTFGKQVMLKQFNRSQNQKVIETKGLKPGIYFIRFSIEGKTIETLKIAIL